MRSFFSWILSLLGKATLDGLFGGQAELSVVGDDRNPGSLAVTGLLIFFLDLVRMKQETAAEEEASICSQCFGPLPLACRGTCFLLFLSAETVDSVWLDLVPEVPLRQG